MSETLLPSRPRRGCLHAAPDERGVALRRADEDEKIGLLRLVSGGTAAELQMEGLFEEHSVEIADGRALDEETNSSTARAFC